MRRWRTHNKPRPDAGRGCGGGGTCGAGIYTRHRTKSIVRDRAQYHMTIDNGRVSLRVDCNTCTGNATRSSTTLSLGPMACTRTFRATAAFETTITTVLSGDHTAAIRGNTLTLPSSRGVVRFER